jgi:predicted Fe-Mo cluster-binding NifX family protein
MILIPVKDDEKTIATGFRKAPMFVFIEPKHGIVTQKNHFKKDKSALFFENFKNYNVDSIYLKGLGYKTYLKLKALEVKIFLIPKDVKLYTHIDPNELVLLNDENAKIYCTLGHQTKEAN